MIMRNMMILVFTGLAFSSCKNQDSKKDSTETDKIEIEEPISQEAENEEQDENAELLDRLENYILTDYLTEADLRIISKDQRKLQIYQIDLNNDGKKEIFVNLASIYFCGTGGCTVLLLDDQLRPITEFTVTQTPIYVEETIENGWKVLMVQSEGNWRKLIYEDGSYPSNPSVAEISRSAPNKTAEILFDDTNGELKTYTF